MSIQPSFDKLPDMERLTKAAAALGYEIVDIAGFLDLVEEQAETQRKMLSMLRARTADIEKANVDVREASVTMARHTGDTAREVEASVALVRSTGEQTRSVAEWVKALSERTGSVTKTLSDVKTNNQQIASIANQVNTLAINAKIEAARAGDAGRGFAVVAEAINELSRKTRDAAIQISGNIETLTSWISTLGKEAETVSQDASAVLDKSKGTDTALVRMEASVTSANQQAQRIADQTQRVEAAMAEFKPAFAGIDASVQSTTSGIKKTHDRILRLIDTSETIVQETAQQGRSGVDGPFIAAAMRIAQELSARLDDALATGRTSMDRLFDSRYQPIRGTDPEQYMTRFTELMDELLPDLQEAALEIDPKVVFCAAVDSNGYLPTHNRQFSQPQGADPVWNTANCRNRRIFDDRVGLKAGRNTEPFLLQVYRRDMGGGEFKMMKDLSAPVTVQGRHWGGIRLAYSY